MNFDLTIEERQDVLRTVNDALEHFYQYTAQLPVAPLMDEAEIKKYARKLSFNKSNEIDTVLNSVINGLRKYTVHTAHPGYYGLFNPRANYLSGVADYITAIFNPQLAAWSHAPYANEIEQYIIEEFAKKLGYHFSVAKGTFCTAGAESNLTAIQCALNYHFPEISGEGVIGLPKRPIIYCSDESHHSIVKAARTTGLGSSSVHSIAVTDDLKMDISLLEQQIMKDRDLGNQPFMVVATAGTTGAGVIDDLVSIAGICSKYNLWMHVDAAFGGGAIASEKYVHILEGIDQSDSAMIDLHKWFSVPMATSLFVTRHSTILNKTFHIKTKYMPEDGDQKSRIDPYLNSIQWSRRFNGLRIYLPMAVFGWSGYDEVITRQIELGDMLRNKLTEHGWVIKNKTQLPVICFTHPELEGDDLKTSNLSNRIVESGKTWISTYPVHGKSMIRACITNYSTTSEDLDSFILSLNKALNYNSDSAN